MPREKLNRNAYLFITYGRRRGHLHADQLAEAGTSTRRTGRGRTQNYAAQEVPKSRVLAAAADRCFIDALLMRDLTSDR